MGLFFAVLLFVFVLLAIIAGASYLIDRSADLPGHSKR